MSVSVSARTLRFEARRARQAEPEPEPEPEPVECSVCLFSYPPEIPMWKCPGNYHIANQNPGPMCSTCFLQWLHGERRADNVGYRQVNCWCGRQVNMDDIREILQPQQVEEYALAMTKQSFEQMRDVIYCPGTDCDNVFIRMNSRKRCRKATCDECQTELCGKCGELYTKKHQSMKCGPYHKWKQNNDEETMRLEQWRAAEGIQVKRCPGCNRNVEKNGGCDLMRCTNCQTRFCWNCRNPYQECSCY